MERRDFMKGLGAVAAAITAITPRNISDELATSYRGWTLRWSGWKDLPNQVAIIGHWTAWKPDSKHAYVSVAPHGICDNYLNLNVFDISLRLPDGFKMCEFIVDPKAQEVARRAAHEKLLRTLDGVK